MKQRITPETVYKDCPRLVKHLTALGETPKMASLPVLLQHLIKLRVSQINSCGYCQHMHSDEARNDGEQQARLDVLTAWRDVSCFSEEEWTSQLSLDSLSFQKIRLFEFSR